MRAPRLFRKAIVSVDIVTDSAEDVLETLTSCFASAGAGGVPELGLGNAEVNMTYTAWKRHLALCDNGRQFQFRSDVMQVLAKPSTPPTPPPHPLAPPPLGHRPSCMRWPS